MSDYDIAHSELTGCYYIMCDGKKVSECTEQIKNIRADVIEEFKQRLLELCSCGSEEIDCTGGNCVKCMDNTVDYSSIVDLAEELKEQDGK